MVMPLTPAMLWGLMKISRSFGLLNASMVACMLGSFVFMYLTLKEWLDRRAALGLTVVSALTYWQFRLATTIMSDPPFVLMFWAGLYLLARGHRQPQRRLLWLGLGAASLLLGVGFRAAGLLMIPTIGLALWLDYKGLVTRWHRLLLAGGVILPMVMAGMAYDAWQLHARPRPREYVRQPRRLPAVTAKPTTTRKSQIIRYIPRLRILVSGFHRSPGILGRWLAESLVAPSRAAFEWMGWQWEAILGGLIAIAAMVGVWQQVRDRNWWLVLPIVYVLAFVALWGIRYIPRVHGTGYADNPAVAGDRHRGDRREGGILAGRPCGRRQQLAASSHCRGADGSTLM